MPDRAELAAKYAEEIRRAYEEAETIMLRRMADRLRKGIAEPGWAEIKMREIQLIRQVIAQETGQLSLFYTATDTERAKIEQWLEEAFANGEKAAAAELASASGVTDIGRDLANAPKAGLQTLSRAIIGDLQGMQVRVLRAAEDIYRSVVSQSATQVLIGTQTRLQAAQSVLNRFAARGIVGFVDKAGRHWDMASYAEMAVRTGTSQAQVQGRVEKFAANGKDLGRFSYAPESCEECDRWEGKIVSLKGLTPGYPTLASVTENSHMLGPNCTHTLNLYTPGLTRDAQPEKGNGEGYQERQRQRYLERGIRDWKRREAVALSDEERAKCAAKVKEWQSSMRDFIEDTGRRRKREREQITGRAR